MISGDQVRMARAALRIGVRDLAAMADLTASTINRFETLKGGVQSGSLEKIQRALETAGVEFIDENGGGAGVRLRERKP